MSTDFPLRNDENTDETVDPSPTEDEAFIEDGVLYDDDVTPEYGILGFTLRELLIVGVWLVHFLLSFFPIVVNATLWSTGIEWLLPVGLPTAAVFLLVLRRFSPDGIRRVGSLGIDQFASVAFSVAAIDLIGRLWLAISGVIGTGFWALSWNGVALVVTGGRPPAARAGCPGIRPCTCRRCARRRALGREHDRRDRARRRRLADPAVGSRLRRRHRRRPGGDR